MEKFTKPKTMWATKAEHQLGDLSRDKGDFCIVTCIEGDNYIGNWLTGYGFCEVKFPVATTRELTPEEAEKQSKFRYYIA